MTTGSNHQTPKISKLPLPYPKLLRRLPPPALISRPRKASRFALLVCLILSLVICQVPIEDVRAISDTTPPVLISYSLNKTEFVDDEFLEITVKATDDLSGLQSASFYYTSGPNGTAFMPANNPQVILVDATTLVFRMQFEMSRMPSAVYTVESLVLTDNVGNAKTYTTWDGNLPVTSFTYINHQVIDQEAPVIEAYSLSMTSGVDGTPVSVLKPGDRLDISYDLKPDPSGITTCFFDLDNLIDPMWSLAVQLDRDPASTDTLVKYAGHITIPACFPGGWYYIRGLSASDNAGNSATYHLDEAGRLTLAALTPEQCKKAWIDNPAITADMPKPIVTNVTFTQSSVLQGDPVDVTMTVDPRGHVLPDTTTLEIGPAGAEVPFQGVAMSQTAPGIYRGSTLISAALSYGKYIASSPGLMYSTNGYQFGYGINWAPNYTVNYQLNLPSFEVKTIFAGTQNTTVPLGATFDPLQGVSAANLTEGDLTSQIQVSGLVDTSKVGVYLLTYTAPSAQHNYSGNETIYYREYRWVGVSEVTPAANADTNLLSVTNDSVVVANNGQPVSMTCNNTAMTYTAKVATAGNYSVKTSAKSSRADFSIIRSGPTITPKLTYLSSSQVQVYSRATDKSEVVSEKWLAGNQTLTTIRNSGKSFIGSFITANAGQVAIYAKNALGYESVKTIDVYCHRVSFNLSGASGTPPTAQTIVHNKTVIKPVNPTRAGYTFLGWYTSASGTTAWNFTSNQVITNRTLYAKWALSKPAVPGSAKAQSASYNSIKVSWKPVSYASGYEIYTCKFGYTMALVGRVPATTTSFLRSGLTTGTDYQFKIRAYRLVGTTRLYGSYTSVMITKPLPPAPANFSLALASPTSIKVSWSAGGGASGYQVYRVTPTTGQLTLLTTTTATSYLHQKLTYARTYTYKVRAYRLVGTTRIYGPFTAAKYLQTH
jgi:uncharacterized repeat protein (TIGR02543 family)